jgi:hypothetical protein
MTNWYESKDDLDYSKPIGAFTRSKSTLILIPCLDNKDSYKISGYNWFDITKGEWNSCCFFKTPQEAVSSYRNIYIYFIRNVKLTAAEKI